MVAPAVPPWIVLAAVAFAVPPWIVLAAAAFAVPPWIVLAVVAPAVPPWIVLAAVAFAVPPWIVLAAAAFAVPPWIVEVAVAPAVPPWIVEVAEEYAVLLWIVEVISMNTKYKYKLPANIARYEKEDKVLYLNPDIPSWVVVNKDSSLLLELCDGDNEIEDIIESYVSVAGEEKRKSATRFFEGVIRSGIFGIPQKGDTPILCSRQVLSIVQLSISSICNLNCKYCYATDREELSFPPMTLSDYHRVIDEICTINPNVSFTITGGEPLLNSDCFDIARYINKKGCRVDILTNGTLINEKNINKIKEYFWKVTISMDGSTKVKHEKFRGPNTYERTTKAIELLDTYSIPNYLSMTVNRLNINDVGDMAKKYGRKLRFAPLFPAGNANKSEIDLSISGKEYYDVLNNTNGVNPLSYCESTLDASQKCRRCKCAIGGSELSISATGDVYPCQLLHYPQFYIGNIHEHSIVNLYRNSDIIEKCARMTVDNIEGCKNCPIKYICGGACRARAYHEKGDIMVSGEFCEYEKKAFINGIFNLYSNNLL